jgi:hypothetical protein
MNDGGKGAGEGERRGMERKAAPSVNWVGTRCDACAPGYTGAYCSALCPRIAGVPCAGHGVCGRQPP